MINKAFEYQLKKRDANRVSEKDNQVTDKIKEYVKDVSFEGGINNH